MTKRLCFLLVLSFIVFRCAQNTAPLRPAAGVKQKPPLEKTGASFPILANSVLYWNEVFLDCVRRSKMVPPEVSRAGAIVHLAIFEALNSVVIPRPRYEPYPFYVPVKPVGQIFPDGAVEGAAVETLSVLFPGQKPFIQQALLASPFRELPGGGATPSFNFGRAVAAHILESRARDLAVPPVLPRNRNPIIRYVPTPDNPLPPMLPHWGNVHFFAIPQKGDSVYWAPNFGPPPLRTRIFTEALLDVRDKGSLLGALRTNYETETAFFWSDDPGTTTPPGHWNLISQSLVRSERLDLLDSARVFALVNLALADAGIGCWKMKYTYFYWRPITALAVDFALPLPPQGMLFPWRPLLKTPNFPEYPSGHSMFSGAAAAVLMALFPNTPFVTGSDGVPKRIVRTYPNAKAAAIEAGYSRILGGIHYTFSNEQGQEAGQAIGSFVVRDFLRLLPR